MSPQSHVSPALVFARVFWMILGPLVLILLAFGIVDLGAGWWAGVDIAFFVALGAMIVARWLEFVLVGGALWVIANLLGHHFRAP